MLAVFRIGSEDLDASSTHDCGGTNDTDVSSAFGTRSLAWHIGLNATLNDKRWSVEMSNGVRIVANKERRTGEANSVDRPIRPSKGGG